jgi:hypothetical protein
MKSFCKHKGYGTPGRVSAFGLSPLARFFESKLSRNFAALHRSAIFALQKAVLDFSRINQEKTTIFQ